MSAIASPLVQADVITSAGIAPPSGALRNKAGSDTFCVAGRCAIPRARMVQFGHGRLSQFRSIRTKGSAEPAQRLPRADFELQAGYRQSRAAALRPTALAHCGLPSGGGIDDVPGSSPWITLGGHSTAPGSPPTATPLGQAGRISPRCKPTLGNALGNHGLAP